MEPETANDGTENAGAFGVHVIARAIRDWSNQDGRAGKCFERIRDQRQARDLNWGNVIGSGSGPWVLGLEREQAPTAADFVEMVKRARGS